MKAELKVSVAAGNATRTSMSCAWPGVGPSPTASPMAAAATGVRSLNIVTSLTFIFVVAGRIPQRRTNRKRLLE
jgi:hypothetical protein